jgi:hypothetical protein
MSGLLVAPYSDPNSIDTDRTAGIRSVTTRMPDSSVVRRIRYR